MTQSVTKLPVTKEENRQDFAFVHLHGLKHEINQLIDQFDRGWRPFFPPDRDPLPPRDGDDVPGGDQPGPRPDDP